MKRDYSLFKTIRFKQVALFSFLLFIIFCILATFFWYDVQKNKVDRITAALRKINASVNQATGFEKDFIIYETIDTNFYASGKSSYAAMHDQEFDTLYHCFHLLLNAKSVQSETGVYKQLINIQELLKQRQQLFDSLVNLNILRGFKDYGLIGKMRINVHAIEDADLPVDLAKLLMIRRHEKDYLLRRQSKYIEKLKFAVQALKNDIHSKDMDAVAKQEMIRLLDDYQNTFMQLVETDKKIGNQTSKGILGTLKTNVQEIKKRLGFVNNEINESARMIVFHIKLIFIGVIIIGIIINILLIAIVTKRFANPVSRLSASIQKVIASNFSQKESIFIINQDNEIGQLSNNIDTMLRKVHRRTNQVVKQKERVEEAFQNVRLLSEIGKDIISNLSIHHIIRTVYHNVNVLMDATIFSVGIYNQEKKALDFWGIKKQGDTRYLGSDYLSNKEHISIQCLTSQQEIVINDFQDEYGNRIAQALLQADSEIKHSMVYLPLSALENRIGVLTIQSYRKNAYDERHIHILRNLAVYISIAIENSNSYSKIQKQNKEISEQAKQLKNAYDNLELIVARRTREVVSQKEEILESNKVLKQQQDNITKSIHYARRIQNAILPPDDLIADIFPHHFILYKPKDIVSGDFYWLKHIGNYLLFAVADCTGHGVPGAFMSMLGVAFLNDIITNRRELKQANQVLNELRNYVKQSLRQTGRDGETKDGMDIALCVVDLNTNEMQYAGAYHTLYLIRHNELKQFKGDKMPIGIYLKEKDTFTNYSLQLQDDDIIYMFSDGYVDQFGGNRGRKFMTRNFKNLLLNIHKKPMLEQKHILNDTIEGWKGTKYEQVDDILVFGVKVHQNAFALKNNTYFDANKLYKHS